MTRGKQSIVIAEDHTILREGLRALISSDPGFEVVAEAGDGQEAINFVEKLKPDLILMNSSIAPEEWNGCYPRNSEAGPND